MFRRKRKLLPAASVLIDGAGGERRGPQRRAALAWGTICIALSFAVPAQAGWFWGSDKPATAQKAGVNPTTVAEIQRAINEERLVDAGNLLEEAFLQSGNDPQLVLLAGRIALARGHMEEALANFKSIDGNADIRAAALEGEGVALSELGRSDEAMKVLQAAVAENPQSWRSWDALGSEYDRRHDWQQAEAAYDHAMTDSDGAPIVLNNRGFSFMLQRKFPEAAADFVAALDKKPDFSAARNNLRLAIAMQGQYDRAVQGAATNDRAGALNNAGFAAMLRGDYAKAKELFAEALDAKGEYYARAATNLETAKAMATKNAAGNASP